MKDEPHSTGVCKRKLSERDVRVLTWIVSKKHETTAAQLTAELNVHLISCFHQNCSPGALQGQYTWTSCYSQTFSHSCQCQTLVSMLPAVEMDNAIHVLFSESTFTVCPISGKVTVWRSHKEAYHPDCCMPRVKHGGGSVKV